MGEVTGRSGRRSVRARTAAAVLVMAVAFGGCARQGDPTPEPSSATSTSSSTSPSPAQTVPGANDADLETAPANPEPPVWDESARISAGQTASAAVAAFARPDLDYAAWWEGFSPFLTDIARGSYGTVDPANLTASAVTGDPVLEAEETPYLAWLQVPTDAGVLRVLLSRTAVGDPWLVERIEETA